MSDTVLFYYDSAVFVHFQNLLDILLEFKRILNPDPLLVFIT